MDLFGIGGTVADVHVVRTSEPQHQVGIHLGRRAGIEQGVHVHLTHVGGGSIPITLS